MTPSLLEATELIDVPVEAPPIARALPAEVKKHVVQGTSTLGAAVLVERGASFLANVMAARLAGPAVFGAYSLGITTANNISTYAAGGIGTTATRFSGKYPYDGGQYRMFAQVMATISLLSAVLAALALSLGAGPIARILHKPDLTHLLQWAGVTAAGMVLLECARGFFVGQRRLLALATLSLLVGLGMLALIPTMAHFGKPTPMVISHGVVTLSAVAVCCVFAARLQLLPPSAVATRGTFLPLLREVWGYGLVQLVGLVSANAAGWWVTALVARGDSTLLQVSFFSIASQLRNLIGLVPSLLTEGSFAAMATPGAKGNTVPQRVMMLCTFASTGVSFCIAAALSIVAPLVLQLMYGRSYAGAALAVSVAAGVAVIQMGNSPPSARLSVVSIRATAAINTVWAVVTAGVGTAYLLHGGTAAGAMSVFMAAHIVIAVLVLIMLHLRDGLPAGMVPLFSISTVAIVMLATLGFYRAVHPEHLLVSSLAMLLVAALALLGLYRIGRSEHCLPTKPMLQSAVHRVSAPLARLFSSRGGAR